MAIEIIDSFKIIASEKGLALGVESDRLEQCMQYAIKQGINRIFIHSYDGYKLENVNFLQEYNFFTGVSITDELIEISGIHNLKDLKYLSLSNGKQVVDLTRFPYLEECTIDWNNKITGLDVLNRIKRLSIWKFKPKSKDFVNLSGCKNVEYLHVTQSDIESFNEISSLGLLNHFEGHYLSKLETLNGIEMISSHLKLLILDYCRKLKTTNRF
jgi:hypothetical protein